MAGWSQRMSRVFLPWGSSLLLHVLILLLFSWLAIITIAPQAQQGVEVELVSLYPGGGSHAAPGPAGEPIKKSLKAIRTKSAVSAKPSPPPLVPKKKKKVPKPVEPVAKQQESLALETSVVPAIPSPPVDTSEQRTTAGEGSETRVTAPTDGAEADGVMGASGGVAGGIEGRFSAVPGAGGGVGGGVGMGGIDWRTLLRKKIESAKRYPSLARRLGMEGTVHVEFWIARDGSIGGIKVAKSSGFPLLDEASVQAIKRAAPLPIVPGRIQVPISYRLHKGR